MASKPPTRFTNSYKIGVNLQNPRISHRISCHLRALRSPKNCPPARCASSMAMSKHMSVVMTMTSLDKNPGSEVGSQVTKSPQCLSKSDIRNGYICYSFETKIRKIYRILKNIIEYYRILKKYNIYLYIYVYIYVYILITCLTYVNPMGLGSSPWITMAAWAAAGSWGWPNDLRPWPRWQPIWPRF